VESSEYVALIDLIAYVAQSLSFRVDLNARENFLETAERRNSILRLARLINYNASRNKTATGLLKFDSVSTTQSVRDFTGTNLANVTVVWNDATNTNYREQFLTISDNIIGTFSNSALNNLASPPHKLKKFNKMRRYEEQKV